MYICIYLYIYILFIYIYIMYLSNKIGSPRKYAQGFKKAKSYSLGAKFKKLPRKAEAKILRTFGYFI